MRSISDLLPDDTWDDIMSALRAEMGMDGTRNGWARRLSGHARFLEILTVNKA